MNFFKKHWVAILIILFFSIVIIIVFFEGIHKAKQEQKSLSNYHEELEDNKESKQPSRTKREIDAPKSKIKITQTKYDKIKSYILSENENEVSPLSDLNQEETNAIEKARNKQKRILNYRKKNKEGIQKSQKECDDYNKKISELDPKQDGYKNELEYLNGILSDAAKLRDSLQRDFDMSQDSYGDPLENIKSLYEIISENYDDYYIQQEIIKTLNRIKDEKGFFNKELLPIIQKNNFSLKFIEELIDGFDLLNCKSNNLSNLVNFDKTKNLTQILFNSAKLSKKEINNYRIEIKKIIEKLCFYFETNLIYLTNENFEIGEYGFESIKNKKSINFLNNKFLIFIECGNNNVLKNKEFRSGFYPKLTQQIMKIHDEIEYKRNNEEINLIISTDDIELIDPDIRAKFCRNEISPNNKKSI